MFQLERRRTKHGLQLAQKLWDFLTLIVEKKYDTRWQNKQLDDWAGTFDLFLRSHDYGRVCAVFDFYVGQWRQKKGFVHLTPASFIGDFPLLEQRYEWTTRPIPESELREILLPLSLERWECEWSNLVTAVSKSVYAIRLFLKGLADAPLPPEMKRKLRGIFGNVAEYVKSHFIKWRKHQIEAVWVATITEDKIFNDVRKVLTRFGYPAQDRDRSIAILRKAIKDGAYAYDRN